MVYLTNKVPFWQWLNLNECIPKAFMNSNFVSSFLIVDETYATGDLVTVPFSDEVDNKHFKT